MSHLVTTMAITAAVLFAVVTTYTLAGISGVLKAPKTRAWKFEKFMRQLAFWLAFGSFTATGAIMMWELRQTTKNEYGLTMHYVHNPSLMHHVWKLYILAWLLAAACWVFASIANIYRHQPNRDGAHEKFHLPVTG